MTVPDRRRRRELASDNRTAVWIRRQNRIERAHVLGLIWRPIAGLVLVAAVLLAAIALLIHQPLLRGLVIGIGASFVIATIAYQVLALSGTVAPAVGGIAEGWTATELRRLRRHGWAVVNGVPLEGRDVDHVLVGPGGVIVIESKWSAKGWQTTPPDDRLQSAIRQAARNARTLRLWKELKATEAPVRAAVLLWGGSRVDAAPRAPKPISIDDTTTLAYGSAAIRSWINALVIEDTYMSEDATQRTLAAFDHLVRERERVDRTAAPPVSAERLAWSFAGPIIAGVATTLASLQLLTTTSSWWMWAAGTLLMAGLRVALRRRPSSRIPATGGLIGLLVAAILIGISAVRVMH